MMYNIVGKNDVDIFLTETRVIGNKGDKEWIMKIKQI